MTTRVLTLCTGGICRSPMAEALLARELADREVDVEVRAAGLLYDGREVSAPAVTVMARRGLDVSTGRSARLNAEMVATADLVLGMQPRHVREAVALVDDVWPRAFVLPDLVRRASQHGPRRPDETLARWLERVGADRRRVDLLREGAGLPDPFGGSVDAYERTAAALEALVRELVDAAWPATGTPRAPAAPSEAAPTRA